MQSQDKSGQFICYRGGLFYLLLTNGSVGRLLRVPRRVTVRHEDQAQGAAGAGQWSVRVSGNWHAVFRFEDGEAMGVALIDYH